VWWIYKRLGRKKRKVIPSCVVSAIRKEFPEADGKPHRLQGSLHQ